MGQKFHKLLFFVLNVFLISLTINDNEIKLYNFDSIVHLTIKGKGEQLLLSDDFHRYNPSKVLVNGINKENCSLICNLEQDINNITLIFTDKFLSCKQMFYQLENIINVDLSEFDFSEVTDMSYMFASCYNIEKIEFGNIDSSSLKNMELLFQACQKLTSMDLSNFDTSKVTDMSHLFSICSEIKTINFGKINTSLVKNMGHFFFGCKKLTSIDVSEFDTSQVTDMSYMFRDCSNLKFLNLLNFNTSKVSNMKYMFQDCKSLIYLNLKSFSINSQVILEDIFININTDLKLCTRNIVLGSVLPNYNLQNDCSDSCFQENIMLNLIYKNCTNSCPNFGYEYKNICDYKCPKGTLLNNSSCEDNECDKNEQSNALIYQNSIECLGKTPQGYYLDLKDEIYKKCFEKCKFCYGYGNETYNNCIECKNNLSILADTIHNTNCYEKCKYYYYFDETNSYKCTDNYTCPKNFTLISDKNQCINLSELKETYLNITEEIIYEMTYINKTEENKNEKTDIDTVEESISENISKESYNINDVGEYIKNPDEIYADMGEKLQSGEYISQVDNGTDYVYTEGKTSYTITSTKNQNNNKNNNVTIIDLGDCEIKLKEKYNISLNDSLYIFKIDILFNILKIEYEVYYPFSINNLTKLDLSVCKDTKIDISIPVDIPINDINKYNKSSDLYNDICYSLTSDSGTDIPLKDRQSEFINNNLSICEEDCTFSSYDSITKKAICSCYTKIKMPLISNIKVDKNKLISNFKDIRNIGNFKVLTCIKKFFNKNNIFKNTSNYIFIILLILSIISILVFVFYNYSKIQKQINAYFMEKKLIDKDKLAKNNIILTNKIIVDNNEKPKINNKKRKKKGKIISNNEKNNNKEEKEQQDIINKDIGKNYFNNENLYIHENNKKIKRKIGSENKNKDKIISKNDKNKLNSISVFTSKELESKYENENKLEKENKYEFNEHFNDLEMNSFNYEEAIKYDQRTYFQYYLSLLKTKHILIFTFLQFKDYNSQLIKIYIFFFTFTINYLVSAMFYSDSTMHKIYEDEGAFDFTYQIPQMFYSLIISSLLKIILNMIGLYEKNILSIKKCKVYDDDFPKKILSCIKLKVVLFFTITYALLFFIWIYLGCFCVVYSNTQIHLLKDVSSSFAFSFITPVFINLLPGLFRFPSLHDRNGKKIYLFKFSKILQIF